MISWNGTAMYFFLRCGVYAIMVKLQEVSLSIDAGNLHRIGEQLAANNPVTSTSRTHSKALDIFAFDETTTLVTWVARSRTTRG